MVIFSKKRPMFSVSKAEERSHTRIPVINPSSVFLIQSLIQSIKATRCHQPPALKKNVDSCSTVMPVLSSFVGIDPGVFLPSRNVRQHERFQVGPNRGRVRGEQRGAAPLGLNPPRVCEDQPAGPRV